MTYQEKLNTAYDSLRKRIRMGEDLDLQDGPYIPETAGALASDGTESYHLCQDLFNLFF